MTPSANEEVLAMLVQEQGLPVRRACQAVRLSRAVYYRPRASRLERDTNVVTALNDVVARHTRWGFWKCFHRLRRAGHPWNHKRVPRVYCALRLNLPRRTKRRVPTRLRQPLLAPVRLNDTWALDFMTDALYDGRRFRTFNVIDEGNREALAIELGTSIPSARVIRVLDDLIRLYGPGPPARRQRTICKRLVRHRDTAFLWRLREPRFRAATTKCSRLSGLPPWRKTPLPIMNTESGPAQGRL